MCVDDLQLDFYQGIECSSQQIIELDVSAVRVLLLKKALAAEASNSIDVLTALFNYSIEAHFVNLYM